MKKSILLFIIAIIAVPGLKAQDKDKLVKKFMMHMLFSAHRQEGFNIC